MLLVIGCSKPTVTEYYQQNFSDVSGTHAKKCTIGTTDYYLASYFIYNINNINAQVVYSPTGEYLKPEGYPRWQFRPFISRNNTVYDNTKGYMLLGKMPNGEILECQTVKTIPPGFQQFIDSHEKLYEGKFSKYEVIGFD